MQLSPKDIINQVNKVWNQIKMKRLKNSNSGDYGPDASVQEFWKFYEVDFSIDLKIPYHPHD
jgi:hypothetical protein